MSKEIYKCAICGKEYLVSNKLSRHIGKEHGIDKKEYYDTYLKKEGEGICHVCGKPTRFLNIVSGYRRHCSGSCASLDPVTKDKVKQTSLERYGVDNPRKAKEIRMKISASLLSRTDEEKLESEEKKKQTCKERYGVEYALQVDEFREKGKITMLEEYGVENAAQSDIIQARIESTNLERHGVKRYNNSDKISSTLKNRTEEEKAEAEAKRKKTNLELYGDENYVNIDKLKETNLEKYGVTCSLRSEEAIEKSKNTCLEKYGTEYPTQSEKVKVKICNTRAQNKLKYQDDNNCTQISTLLNEYGEGWYKNGLVDIFHHGSGAYVSNEDIDKIKDWAENCKRQGSSLEANIKDYLQTIYKGDIIKSRQVIAPYEIDLFIPEYNIGIECNGTYWHSMLCNNDENYHLMKSKLAEEKGIRLIHIYEFEWKDKNLNKEVKQILKTALNKYNNSSIVEVNDYEVKCFLNEEDVQVSYNLYYKGHLVQFMSFNRTEYENEWEMVTKSLELDDTVEYDASKLLKQFIEDYSPSKIFSYCDFNKFDGTFYEKLGMKFVEYTGPNKWYWLDTGEVIAEDDEYFQDNNILSIIWGSGSKKYEWLKEEVI